MPDDAPLTGAIARACARTPGLAGGLPVLACGGCRSFRFHGEEARARVARLPLSYAASGSECACGYTLLNRYSAEVDYSHWHITDPGLRGLGLSTALYPHRIKTYFDSVPMDRLIHQTRTSNIGVNRMLDRYVPIVETRYIEHPDGVALPGKFHLRYVFLKDIPRLFEKGWQYSS